MSKTRKKSHISNTSDITLNDFANSGVKEGCGRLKKKPPVHVTEVNILKKDTRALKEKLEDLLPGSLEVGEEETRKKPPRTKTKLERDESGVDYPIDVWYLISNHIAPEDVITFASICKSANAVTHSPNFWLSMYKRYYRPSLDIPEHLQPECIKRRYKLRTLVIQFLYLTYPPFLSRMGLRLEVHPQTLVGRVCVAFWSKKEDGKENQWVYNFKLKEMKSSRWRQETEPKRDLLTMLDDIDANPDEDCKLLQVRANAYCPLPMVTSMKLVDSKLTIETSYLYRRLVLNFALSPSNYQVCTVNMHSVICTRVLNWWDPDFVPSEPPPASAFAPMSLGDEFC